MGFRGRYRNKRDTNEPLIVQALQAHGFSVVRLDVPADLLLGKHGRTWLAEVKQEGCKLSDPQSDFYDGWRGNKLILRGIEDVTEFAESVN